MKARKWLYIALAALLLLSLFGCAANSTATDSMEMANGSSLNRAEASSKELADGRIADTETSSASTMPENRKWIVTVYMNVETEDLDTLLSSIGRQIEDLEGYVEAQQVYNGSSYSGRRYRSASLTVRIPAERVDSFTAQVGGVSNVVSQNKDLEDVTLSYVATESRMTALQAEEARLLELMAQAENMSDLLEIESRLTEVRYELERVTSQLRVYDNQVDYATINLSISEVQEYTVVEEETIWQRISKGFVNSLKNLGNFFVELFVFIIVSLPYLLLGGGIAFVAVKLAYRKRKQKKEEKSE